MNALLILGGMALTGLVVLWVRQAHPPKKGTKKRSYHYPPERLQ